MSQQLSEEQAPDENGRDFLKRRADEATLRLNPENETALKALVDRAYVMMMFQLRVVHADTTELHGELNVMHYCGAPHVCTPVFAEALAVRLRAESLTVTPEARSGECYDPTSKVPRTDLWLLVSWE